ncbi:MAG: hypothetical protein KME52_20480 [Desmonostoc geniculatum HA4340-LM1]|nr:hypothetical protein [Desmonostoc geniculatum HA4340-LM1]
MTVLVELSFWEVGVLVLGLVAWPCVPLEVGWVAEGAFSTGCYYAVS